MNDFLTVLHGGETVLEYIDTEHIYVCNGIIIPSVTQLMHATFPDKYANINERRLQAAAERGSAVHSVIEQYVTKIDSTPLTDELRGFRFLQRMYGFDPVSAEIPLVWMEGGDPVFAGRMDLLIDEGGKRIIADVKSTCTLDRKWLLVQLNLYRLAYEQSYGEKIDGLRGIHLKGNTRKYVEIPIDEKAALDAIQRYKETKENGRSEF